jgi:hypothetical protein
MDTSFPCLNRTDDLSCSFGAFRAVFAGQLATLESLADASNHAVPFGLSLSDFLSFSIYSLSRCTLQSEDWLTAFAQLPRSCFLVVQLSDPSHGVPVLLGLSRVASLPSTAAFWASLGCIHVSLPFFTSQWQNYRIHLISVCLTCKAWFCGADMQLAQY